MKLKTIVFSAVALALCTPPALAAPTSTPPAASALSLTPNIRTGPARGHSKLAGGAAILGVLIVGGIAAIIGIGATQDDKPDSN